MKIYFAGSIRGGREKQQDYFEIIKFCGQFGEVLTEHVGDSNLKVNGEQKTDEYIYLRDVNWIEQSDIILADVTIASLGVGYEIAYAEKLNKNIICIYDKNTNNNISAMISGNKNLYCKGYNDLEEAKKIIQEHIK